MPHVTKFESNMLCHPNVLLTFDIWRLKYKQKTNKLTIRCAIPDCWCFSEKKFRENISEYLGIDKREISETDGIENTKTRLDIAQWDCTWLIIRGIERGKKSNRFVIGTMNNENRTTTKNVSYSALIANSQMIVDYCGKLVTSVLYSTRNYLCLSKPPPPWQPQPQGKQWNKLNVKLVVKETIWCQRGPWCHGEHWCKVSGSKWTTGKRENNWANSICLTPIKALSSVMVTCLARSTAVATCCWCWNEKKGSKKGPMQNWYEANLLWEIRQNLSDYRVEAFGDLRLPK